MEVGFWKAAGAGPALLPCNPRGFTGMGLLLSSLQNSFQKFNEENCYMEQRSKDKEKHTDIISSRRHGIKIRLDFQTPRLFYLLRSEPF